LNNNQIIEIFSDWTETVKKY